VPPRPWTAWPLPADTVPHSEFMKRIDDDNDRFTFRMPGQYTPGAELEEIISATMLRLAKERFQARQSVRRGVDAVSSGPETSDQNSGAGATTPGRAGRSKSGSRPRSIKHESASEAEKMDVDDPDSSTVDPSERSKRRVLLKPVVATDDELSYNLTRPSAQRILEKLDATLVVLHNAQESRMHCLSDSDTSDASSRSHSRSPSRSRSRSRSLPRSHSYSAPPRESSPQPLMTPPTPKKRVGRPKKEYPRLEGETDKEYLIRVARIQKRPLPVFPEDDDPEPMTDSTPVPVSTTQNTDGKTRRKAEDKGKGKARTKLNRARAHAASQSRTRRETTEPLSDATLSGEARERISHTSRKAKVRPRDWREILGAAALAGFPAPVLDRAARRCADLFGQSFVLHTLPEGPSTDNQIVTRYDPGVITTGIPPPLLDDDLEDWVDEDEGESRHRNHHDERRRSRTPGTSSALLFEGDRGRSRSIAARSRSGSKSRSRSASAGGSVYFCIVSNCPRAVDAFSRRTNLMRHLKLVHNFDGEEVPVEVDSEDEMYGAVHVDGFLKPIKIRSSWRNANSTDNAAKEKRRPRRRNREVGDDDDIG
jgi:hypothetical protein